MRKIYYFFFMLLAVGATANPAPDLFPAKKGEFIVELKSFFKDSRNKKALKDFHVFEKMYKSGNFSDNEIKIIINSCNLMLQNHIKTVSFFSDYLKVVRAIKNSNLKANYFLEWNKVEQKFLSGLKKAREKKYKDFLIFSVHFFEQKALRYATRGVSWFASSDLFSFNLDNGNFFVSFESTDIHGAYKNDTISIYNTGGKYFPLLGLWEGDAGRVTWEGVGMDKTHFAELAGYNIKTKLKKITAEHVTLHYPTYLRKKTLKGTLTDQVVVGDKGQKLTYPRFVSDEKHLDFPNIDDGIDYSGGFELHGAKLYGYGTKKQKAQITIKGDDGKTIFRGEAMQFVIKPGKSISGKHVRSNLYFSSDSLFNPSVAFTYYIQEKRVELSQTADANDKTPFHDSKHQMNIFSKNVNYTIGADTLSFGKNLEMLSHSAKRVSFESADYFDELVYRRFQNAATRHPLVLLKDMSEEQHTDIVNAEDYAYRINSRFTTATINPLIYDLVKEGFIFYDPETKEITIREKLTHYIDAAKGDVDFDEIKITSETSKTNATFNVKNNNIAIRGVKNFEISRKRRTAFVPENEDVVMNEDKSINFSGEIFSGFSRFEGNGFHFSHDEFMTTLDSVEKFNLFLPTGEMYKNGEPKALGLTSTIENFSGVLAIDAPYNKSGKEDLPKFPSLSTDGYSFVYYADSLTQNGVYSKDNFYFRLNKFTLNGLDKLTPKKLHFKGNFFSAEIFEPMTETVSPQGDGSLGFEKQLNSDTKVYRGKGTYSGKLTLTNKGLLGKGTIKYLWATINSDKVVFKPEELEANAKEFRLEEKRTGGVEVPQVYGKNVSVDWKPYKDKMFVRSKDDKFQFYKDNQRTLNGLVMLTPGGVKGKGVFELEAATMTSNLFDFGAHSFKADTLDVVIRSQSDSVILKSTQMKADVDFDTQMAHFDAIKKKQFTFLPGNRFKTSLTTFVWDMKNQLIKLNSRGKKGVFISTSKNQAGLSFDAAEAYLENSTNGLKIKGVTFVKIADVLVYPQGEELNVGKGGKIEQLKDAKIIADTINQYHVIHKAEVDIISKKNYRASGFYEYNVGDKKQEIWFDNITLGKPKNTKKQKVKRKKNAPKKVNKIRTVASGEITRKHNFYIDKKTKFIGTIELQADKKELHFSGFGHLDSPYLPEQDWFSMDCEADKNELILDYDEPKNFTGASLYTGLFLSRYSGDIYPAVLMSKRNGKDRAIFTTKGKIKYDAGADEFLFGDSLRIVGKRKTGNLLTLENVNGSVKTFGSFDFSNNLLYPAVSAVGNMETSISTAVTREAEFSGNIMAGIELYMPDEVLSMMSAELVNSAVKDVQDVKLSDSDYYKTGFAELFKDSKKVDKIVENVAESTFYVPEKDNKFTFLFGKTPMRWSKQGEAMISTKPMLNLMSVKGDNIMKRVEGYLAFKMVDDGFDGVYVYLKSAKGKYYYFSFVDGTLEIATNNQEIVDKLTSMKEKNLRFKVAKGKVVEVIPVETAVAQRFERKMRALLTSPVKSE